ncbi:unnamed protein product, partial [Allacma fusca]
PRRINLYFGSSLLYPRQERVSSNLLFTIIGFLERFLERSQTKYCWDNDDVDVVFPKWSYFGECQNSVELTKLSEESLTRQPEEVFDIICKLGEGSYGSVYKALHKESGQVLAIKQVPVDTDLQEIIKEISIMQQCDSPYVVKYYGSYFKNTDLWVNYLLEYFLQ